MATSARGHDTLLAGAATVRASSVRPGSTRATVEPVGEWVEVYRERREVFRALYPALSGLSSSA